MRRATLGAAAPVEAPRAVPPRPLRWEGAARARRRAAAERQRAQLAERSPEHVRHCYHQGARDWWIYTWRKDNAAKCQRVPYTCESWRCPTCRRHDAAINFARIREASEPLDPRGWCFLTLTLCRERVHDWRDTDAAYKDLSRKSRNFFQALRRFHCDMGWATYEQKRVKRGKKLVWKTVARSNWSSQWVGVVEAHRSGWPHMHFMIWSPELADWSREQSAEFDDDDQRKKLLPPELRRLAREAGWGHQGTLEAAKNREAMAGYLVKLSGEADALSGELSKMTQLPTMAPNRFRRLRSGKNFLPPRRKNEDYTGTLVRRRLSQTGDLVVSPIHRVEDCPMVELACATEERLAEESRNLRTPEKPLVQVAVPTRVLQSYDVARLGAPSKLGRAGGVVVRRTAEGASLHETATEGAQPLGQPETVAEERAGRCQRPKRLKPTGAPSALRTSPTASTPQPTRASSDPSTGSRESPRSQTTSNAEPVRQARLPGVSARPLVTRPPSSAVASGGAQSEQLSSNQDGAPQRAGPCDSSSASTSTRRPPSQDARNEEARASDADQGSGSLPPFALSPDGSREGNPRRASTRGKRRNRAAARKRQQSLFDGEDPST